LRNIYLEQVVDQYDANAECRREATSHSKFVSGVLLSRRAAPVFRRLSGTIIGELGRVFFARPISDVFPNFRCPSMLCVDSNRPDGMRWVNSLNSSSSWFAPFDHDAAGKRDCDGRTECHLHGNGHRHGSIELPVAEEPLGHHRSNLIQLHNVSDYHRGQQLDLRCGGN